MSDMTKAVIMSFVMYVAVCAYCIFFLKFK